PQASVTVKVTSAVPVIPHPLVNPEKLCVHVNELEQASSAVAPARLFNQAVKSLLLPVPSHSTTKSSASVIKSGAVASSIVKVACLLTLFPLASVAVNCTVVRLVFPHNTAVSITE